LREAESSSAKRRQGESAGNEKDLKGKHALPVTPERGEILMSILGVLKVLAVIYGFGIVIFGMLIKRAPLGDQVPGIGFVFMNERPSR
jgi:hypothetical protein